MLVLLKMLKRKKILIATQKGYCTRFLTDTMRETGRDTMGVKAITLRRWYCCISYDNKKSLKQIYLPLLKMDMEKEQD